MAKIERRSTLPYYVTAIVWFLYGLLYPLYTVRHYLLVGILSVAVFLGFRAFLGVTTEEVPDALEDAPELPEDTEG